MQLASTAESEKAREPESESTLFHGTVDISGLVRPYAGTVVKFLRTRTSPG
jgi:hypothetical protein